MPRTAPIATTGQSASAGLPRRSQRHLLSQACPVLRGDDNCATPGLPSLKRPPRSRSSSGGKYRRRGSKTLDTELSSWIMRPRPTCSVTQRGVRGVAEHTEPRDAVVKTMPEARATSRDPRTHRRRTEAARLRCWPSATPRRRLAAGGSGCFGASDDGNGRYRASAWYDR
jgi:hypothetical protein